MAVLLLLLLLLKKIGNARLGEGDCHPISPKTPAPHYQPIANSHYYYCVTVLTATAIYRVNFLAAPAVYCVSSPCGYCVAVAAVVADYCVANYLAVSALLCGALRECAYKRPAPLSGTVRALYAWFECTLPPPRTLGSGCISGEGGTASHMTNTV